MAARVLYLDGTNPSLTQADGYVWSCGRASWATVSDADGYLYTVADNVPAFEGATPITNWAQETEALANWANNLNVTVTDDQDSVTDGGQTISLSKVVGDATVGQHYARQANQVSPYFASEGFYRLYSCYVKGGTTGRYVTLQDGPWNNSTRVNIFDTQTGAWAYEGTFYQNFGSQSLGGGYYRIWFTDSQHNTAYDEQYIGVTTTADWADVGLAADGYDIYAGGMMIEIVKTTGTLSPSTYTPNAGTATIAGDSVYEGVSEYLRSEPANTNDSPYSDIGDNVSGWWGTGTNTVLTPQAAEAPDGSQNACSVTGNGAVTTTGQVQLQHNPVTIPQNEVNISSIYMRSDAVDTHQYVAVSYGNYGTNNYAQCFDLTNGQLGTASENVDEAGIEEVIVNGTTWYRCWHRFTQTDIDTSGILRIMLVDADETTVNSCNPQTAGTVYMWGHQQEVASTGGGGGDIQRGPSSLINTNGTSVTRAADNINLTDMTWFPTPAKLSMYMDCSVDYDDNDTAGEYLLYLFEQSTRHITWQQYTVGSRTGELRTLWRDNGTQTGGSSGNNDIVPGTRFKAVHDAELLVGGSLWFNGVEKDPPSSAIEWCDTPTGLYVGITNTGTLSTYMKLYEMAWWDTTLTDVQKEELTLNGTMPEFDEAFYLRRRKIARAKFRARRRRR